MTEVTTWRHNHHIDPHLGVWEWQIPAYLFLGGLVAGLMILGALWRMRRGGEQGRALTFYGGIAAPVLLSLGMLFLLWDLAYPTHVYRFYMAFRPTSPMSWGAWILILVYPAQILALALPGGIERFGGRLQFLNGVWDKVKQIARRVPSTINSVNIGGGVLLGIYTGVLLGTMAARPLWNSALLPPLFLVSGFSAAAAFGLLAKPREAEKRMLVRYDIAALATEMVILLLMIVGLTTGSLASQRAAELILGGPFTASFWVIVVGLGLLLPLWLEVREMRHAPVPLWLGPALVLFGGLALRFVLVIAGQVSEIPHADTLDAAARMMHGQG